MSQEHNHVYTVKVGENASVHFKWAKEDGQQKSRNDILAEMLAFFTEFLKTWDRVETTVSFSFGCTGCGWSKQYLCSELSEELLNIANKQLVDIRTQLGDTRPVTAAYVEESVAYVLAFAGTTDGFDAVEFMLADPMEQLQQMWQQQLGDRVSVMVVSAVDLGVFSQ